MMEMLAYDFMQRAIVAGLIVGVLCSFISFFVLLKRLSFVGVGISHSAFGGVALGLFLGVNPVLAGGLFATLVAWCIGYVSRRGEIQEDASIGIFFSCAMALGITVVGFKEGYYIDLFSFLFGNILAVNAQDLRLLAGLGAAVLLLLGLFFKELLFMCFDEEMARVNGVPVSFLYYLLLTCIAVTVVVAVKVVGIILASALLVIPAATAHELTGNFRRVIPLSVLAGVFSAMAGLWLSYNYNLASGSTIVLFAGLLFLLAFTFSPRRRNPQKLWRYLNRKFFHRSGDRPGQVPGKDSLPFYH